MSVAFAVSIDVSHDILFACRDLATPRPPATVNAPVVTLVLSVSVVTLVPEYAIFPPTYRLPAIPTPPATSNAPVEVEDEAVVRGILVYDLYHSIEYNVCPYNATHVLLSVSLPEVL